MLTLTIVVALVTSSSLALPLELVILHTNDVHARIRQTSKYSGACSERDVAASKCYGGVARRVTEIDKMRNRYPNVLLADGGDQWTGTQFSHYYKGLEASHFMNLLKYDVMALGNHEFDNGVEGLIPFIEHADFPVLSCNLNASNEPLIRDLFLPYTEKVYGGETVGIVGYTTKKTTILVDPTGIKNLVFHDEVEEIRKVVEDMKARGINKIIALGHAGFGMDQTIAREVDGVDVVIGGHSNTFLMTGEAPSNEESQGEYPYVVTTDTGATVLVVQAYAFGKYLGFLKVYFNEQGDISEWEGNPILLDGSIERDPDVLDEVEEWAVPLKNLTMTRVGESRVFLDGQRASCRLKECSMGNLVTDAIVFNYILMTSASNGSWSDTSAALWNGGGIRSSIEIGPVILADILQVLPFSNTVEAIKLKGRYIWEALEHSASLYKPLDLDGGFLQMSGLKVVYDLSQPVGQRVQSVYIICTACEIPEYEQLDLEKVYGLLTSSYMLNGGDGYSMLKENLVEHNNIGALVSDWLAPYVTQHSPIIQGMGGRISLFTQCEGDLCSATTEGARGGSSVTGTASTTRGGSSVTGTASTTRGGSSVTGTASTTRDGSSVTGTASTTPMDDGPRPCGAPSALHSAYGSTSVALLLLAISILLTN